MKAVIVEIRGNYAAALSDDGVVRQVKNRQYSVGQEILIALPGRNTALIRRAACAAAAVILLSTTGWAYYSPYSYVSLDVNPSIEYSVNRFDRVLSCIAVNGDGADIVDGLRLKHKNIQDALGETIQKIADAGYLKGEQAGIMITASSKSPQKSKDLADDLKETAEEETARDNPNVNLEAVEVGLEYVQQARQLGVTPGKLVLVGKLKDSGTELTEDELRIWLDSPVKDIMEQIQENKKEEKAQNGRDKDKGDTEAPPNADQGNNGRQQENPRGNPAGNSSVRKDATGNNGNNDVKTNHGSKNAK